MFDFFFKKRTAPTPPPPTPIPRPRPSGQKMSLGYLVNTGVGVAYDALKTGDENRTPVSETFPSLFPSSNPWSRGRFSRMARTIAENGGPVGYALEIIRSYSVPVKIQAETGDKAWDDEAEDFFYRVFAPQADYLGRPIMDLHALQGYACEAMDIDGDIGVTVISEGPEDLPKVQLIEGHRIDCPPSLQGSPVVSDGVRLDSVGRVAGYYVANGRITGKGVSEIKYELLTPNDFLLMYDPGVSTPIRGVSALRRGMNEIRDAREILGFEKILQKQRVAMAGVIEGGYLDEAGAFKVNSETDPDPGESAPVGSTDRAIGRMDLTGGDIPILPEGRKFNPIPVAASTAGFVDTQDYLIGCFVAGLGLPPAFFLDTKLTGPNVRSVIGKAQKKFNRRQDAMCAFDRFVWNRVMAWAMANGRLKPNKNFDRIRFQRPAQSGIDLGDEAAADLNDLTRGITTRAAIYGKRGGEWSSSIDQLFVEDEYIIQKAKDLASKSGVPIDIILSRHFGSASQQAPLGQQGGSQDKPNDQKPKA